jgi:hypothetical protein
VSTGAEVRRFRAAYASALGDYLGEPSERLLRTAYELGREAVSRRLSVLDLVLAHQEALEAIVRLAPERLDAGRVTQAGGDFLLESLSSFEMLQRGLGEAREAARLERRQSELSRRLSTFLADASLALEASDSLEEMLRLVAEQARELVGAECCLATVAAGGGPRTAEAASFESGDRRWAGFVRWLDLFAIYGLVREAGGSVRMTGDRLSAMPQFRPTTGGRPLRGWLAASFTALDGGELGAIQLFDKDDGEFTGDDEAVLLHLAQMASAAIERTRLYQERGAEG